MLQKGGTFLIEVPHFTSRDNWIDPTHKKSFSIRTFEFFVKDSRFGRSYYFDFAFESVVYQHLTFEKPWLPCTALNAYFRFGSLRDTPASVVSLNHSHSTFADPVLLKLV